MTRDSDEWGPWIEHDGSGCPVHPNTIVAVQFLDESDDVPIANPDGDLAKVWWWGHRGWGLDIIRYRIRKPRALLQLRDMVENLPERERADT